MAVLPRPAGRGGSIPDTYRSEPLCGDRAIGAIPITNEVSKCLIPWECLGDLPRDPLGLWVRGDIGQDQPPPLKIQDHEPVQEFEANGRYDEVVNGCDVRRVIAEEGFPVL